MSILKALFDGKYSSPQENQRLPPELLSRRRDLINKIEAAMGADFLEESSDLLCDIERIQNFTFFRKGFRLGALLMLEAFSPER